LNKKKIIVKLEKVLWHFYPENVNFEAQKLSKDSESFIVKGKLKTPVPTPPPKKKPLECTLTINQYETQP
jgi:hypothetical protein